MDSNPIVLAGIDIGIFLGLIGIAIAIFFGLRGFGKGLTNELSTIKEKVIIIQETVGNLWDVAKHAKAFGGTGTVERELNNIGKVAITAEPELNKTTYHILTKKAVFHIEDMLRVGNQTEIATLEEDIFGEALKVIVSSPIPTRLKIVIPSRDSKKCTEYISRFLKWLDSTYWGTLPKVADFEEGIEV